MGLLSIVCVVLLLLPALLAYIHTSANKRIPSLLIHYRYFMAFNMVFSGMFVATRVMVNGHNAAAVSGWAYSPLFNLYGVAILSMSLLALFTIFSRKSIVLAPALLWSIFLTLSSITQLIQINAHVTNAVGILLVHVAYNTIVTVVMLRFAVSIKGRLHESPIIPDASVTA